MGGIGMCIVIFWPCFEAWSAVLFYRDITQRKRPPYHRKYVLFFDYTIMSPTCYFYQWQVNLRRLVFCFLLVIADKTQYVSIGILVFMQVAALLWVSIVRPFRSKVRNVAVCVNEAGLLILYGIAF